MRFLGFPRIMKVSWGFPGTLRTPRDSKRLQRILGFPGLQGIPGDSKGFLGFPRIIQK